MERKEIHIEWLTKNFYCTLLVLDFRYENLQWRAFWAENYTIIQYLDLWKETIFQRRELGIQKLTMMLWKKKIHEISRNCPNSGILEIVTYQLQTPLWLFKETAFENHYQKLTQLGVVVDGHKWLGEELIEF